MPLQRNEFIPGNLLTVYTAPSGLVDIRTGQAYQAGGLYPGVYFDLTESEAQLLSGNVLHAGRYRFVQLDNGATAANILAGTVGGMVLGKGVQNVVIKTAGSGQTQGVYTVNATGGGGSGAQISVVITSGGVIGSITVLNPGSGYTSVPTFTLVTGGTPGTVQAQMVMSFNAVTSIDKSPTAGVPLHAVVFLAPVTAAQITAGAWIFIQELGEAVVLGKSALTNGAPAIGDMIIVTANGQVDDPTQSGNITHAVFATLVGEALDVPVASALFKVMLDVPVVQG